MSWRYLNIRKYTGVLNEFENPFQACRLGVLNSTEVTQKQEESQVTVFWKKKTRKNESPEVPVLTSSSTSLPGNYQGPIQAYTTGYPALGILVPHTFPRSISYNRNVNCKVSYVFAYMPCTPPWETATFSTCNVGKHTPYPVGATWGTDHSSRVGESKHLQWGPLVCRIVITHI